MEEIKVEVDENDLKAMRARAKATPRETGGATVRSRARGEKGPSQFDARRLPLKKDQDNLVPLNVDVPREIKKLVNEARANYGLPIRAFVAEAIKRYARELEIQMQSGE